MKRLLVNGSFGVLICAISACSFNATLMARDSGRTYSGTLHGNGFGSGTMEVTIDGTTYTGPAARVGSNETLGLISTYGTNSHGGTATSFGTAYASGDVMVKALLSSASGRGLRCDLRGQSRTAGGVCVDDAQKVYDVILVRN